ncbi:tetratricopeptide repeat protein [Desulfuromonas sp. KJ2020]|uniref:O-linked N-acetylglucosamine transferase, SPINDLY family protein n=1 Tax=Desulfuromonas sp. KJ2020 TaxID=2919173 RepID=UPI0020A7E54B|nr:tetratricopeptide repeat protein [Desulfuromonas sp. KJ2020]MCP3178436.1 tetratricopeptide repeat protein [Desulfuromonas sp. KJ2020]
MGKKIRNNRYPAERQSADSLIEQAMSLFRHGRVVAAVEILEKGLRQQPGQAQLWFALGCVCQGGARFEEAIRAYREALRVNPALVEAWNNLGTLYAHQALRAEAEECFNAALQHRPGMHDASINLGRILVEQGRAREAIAIYQAALAGSPKPAEILYALAVAFRNANRVGQAMVHLEESLAQAPDYADAHNLMGVLLMDMGMAEDSRIHFEKAIALNPRDDGPWTNLACLLQSLGRYREAYSMARTAVDLAPQKPLIHSNLLFLSNYQDSLGREEIFAEQRRWNERHALPLTRAGEPPVTEKNPDKKLRIGYVSPDFRFHPVCFFITPILAGFDRERFEVTCYSNVLQPDEQTEALRGLASRWRDICGVPDDEVVRWIREDKIDILVDLAGHSGDNRLLVFARKPAPIQVTFLGNPDGTGMDAMDYRITDAWCDPVGLTEPFHREELIRLPGNFFCYAPPSPALDIAPLPWRSNGYVTFGSFNNFSKISNKLLETWCTILHAVPDSRLFFQGKPMSDHVKVSELKTFFERRGIHGERIHVRGNTSFQEHMNLLSQVDIALDTFPWNGHTTTCHTLWMGVPVVALEGERGISRMGMSILCGLGEERLVARTVEEYVSKAVALAETPEALSHFRMNIRAQILNSPWGKQEQYNANLDAVYRDLWRKYCGVCS